MATLTINYDKRNSIAKKFIDFGISAGLIKVTEELTSEYDPKFVQKIEQGRKERKEGKGASIKTEDLWK